MADKESKSQEYKIPEFKYHIVSMTVTLSPEQRRNVKSKRGKLIHREYNVQYSLNDGMYYSVTECGEGLQYQNVKPSKSRITCKRCKQRIKRYELPKTTGRKKPRTNAR